MKKLPWLAAGVALLITASFIPGPYHDVVHIASQPQGLLVGSHLDAQTTLILKRSCGDCHSYATVWPVYARIAPISWLVRRDVSEGRKFMNLSLWDKYGMEGQTQLLLATQQNILDSSMPPRRFTLLHPDAKLNEADRAHLKSAFEAEAGRLSKESSTQH